MNSTLKMTRPRRMPDLHEGDCMDMEDWEDARACNAITPDDGSGYWGNEYYYDADLYVWGTPRPSWATHVAWFNK